MREELKNDLEECIGQQFRKVEAIRGLREFCFNKGRGQFSEYQSHYEQHLEVIIASFI